MVDADPTRGPEPGTLLTPEVTDWIGREHNFGPEPVLERDVLRYLAATQAALPAKGTSPRVPRMFYRVLGRPVSEVDRIGDDGLWPDVRPRVGSGQTLGGGIEVQFVRDLVVGDVVTGRRRLVSLEEKTGRRRTFVVATWETTLWDADGVEVVSENVNEILY